jgi:hypothetical protein
MKVLFSGFVVPSQCRRQRHRTTTGKQPSAGLYLRGQKHGSVFRQWFVSGSSFAVCTRRSSHIYRYWEWCWYRRKARYDIFQWYSEIVLLIYLESDLKVFSTAWHLSCWSLESVKETFKFMFIETFKFMCLTNWRVYSELRMVNAQLRAYFILTLSHA